VWDGEIDARHLYAALQLAVYTHERDGSNSNQSHAFSGHYRRESSYDDHVGQIVGQNQASHRLALLAPACVSLRCAWSAALRRLQHVTAVYGKEKVYGSIP